MNPDYETYTNPVLFHLFYINFKVMWQAAILI